MWHIYLTLQLTIFRHLPSLLFMYIYFFLLLFLQPASWSAESINLLPWFHIFLLLHFPIPLAFSSTYAQIPTYLSHNCLTSLLLYLTTSLPLYFPTFLLPYLSTCILFYFPSLFFLYYSTSLFLYFLTLAMNKNLLFCKSLQGLAQCGNAMQFSSVKCIARVRSKPKCSVA